MFVVIFENCCEASVCLDEQSVNDVILEVIDDNPDANFEVYEVGRKLNVEIVPQKIVWKQKKGTFNMAEPIQEILDHNKEIVFQIKQKEAELRILYKKIKPPCFHCPYDGVYRCEACTESMYEGFNIKDYPD